MKIKYMVKFLEELNEDITPPSSINSSFEYSRLDSSINDEKKNWKKYLKLMLIIIFIKVIFF